MAIGDLGDSTASRTVGSSQSSPATTDPVSHVKTFLFVDIRGYTRFTQERGDEAAGRLVAAFTAYVREGVETRAGTVIGLSGDQVLAVFGSARQALRTAIELQSRFDRESTRDPSLPLRAGIGLDAGEPVPVDGGYQGEALNLASRLCSLAGPGEVLASEGVIHLARKLDGIDYVDRGEVTLKGFLRPMRVISVTPSRVPVATVASSFAPTPPTRSDQLPVGGFLGSLPAGSLVGREEEMARILPILDVVLAGEGRLVLLAGEPGVGKTRVAQEVTVEVLKRDFIVAAGRCSEAQQAVPYAAFREALEAAYAVAPASIRSEAVHRWPFLIRLLPDDLAPSGPVASDSMEDQPRLFRAITGFLQAVAQSIPVALLLDDLQWGDGATLELLHHLARNTRGSRILILGTYRDIEIRPGHAMEAVLRDLGREQLMERVPIRRLAIAGTAALIGELLTDVHPPDELVALVHRHTDGNAYFTEQVVRTLLEAGSVFLEDGRWRHHAVHEIDVPESVRSVIGQRTARLPAIAQEVIHEASVLGQSFAFEDLHRMGIRSEDDVDIALTEACALGLLRVTEKDGYAFDHALTQQALYASLSPRRKKRLHRTAGETLEQLPALKRRHRAAEIAKHWLEGDDPTRALPYTLLAGDEAEVMFAHAEGEQHYRAALEILQDLEIDLPEEHASALEKLGGVLKMAGRSDEALGLLERAAEMYRAQSDTEGRARTLAQIGRLHGSESRPEVGIAHLRAELAEVDRGQISHDLAQLYAALVQLYGQVGWQQEQLTAAERLLALAQAGDDARLLAEAELQRGLSLMHTGEYDAALPILEAAIERAERVGDLSTVCSALHLTSIIYHTLGEPARAMADDLRSLHVAERLGDPREITYRATYTANRAFILGDWPQAHSLIQRALTAAMTLDSVRMFFSPLILAGEQNLYEGNWEVADNYLRDAGTIAHHLGAPEMLREHATILAERDFLQDDPQRALDRLLLLRNAPDWQDHLTFVGCLARALLGTGACEEAADLAVRAWELADHDRLPLGKIETLRIQGLVAAELQQVQAAEDFFSRAIEMAQDVRYPWGEARARLECGQMLAANGDPDRARDQLQQACRIFSQLGARMMGERAEVALRALPSPR